MNCKTFMRKLPDFIENAMMHDMSEAMEKHMKECNSCKKTFDEEKDIDLAFSMALDIDDISFNSCRADIMKNINKNRYSKSPINKIKHGLKKFQIQIISTAAVFLMTLVISPYIMQQYVGSSSTESGIVASKANEDNKLMAQNNENSSLVSILNDGREENTEPEQSVGIFDKIDRDSDEMQLLINSKKIYVPEFTKVDLEVDEELDFATDWTESPDKSLKVAIEGRGSEAKEQGIGKLVFINKNTSKMWKLSLANNESKQFTPMKVSWYDNENLLVIFGYGQGRVTLGGDVILLNAFTGKAVNIYWEYSLDNKKQVVEASRNYDKIDLKVILYDDKVNHYKEELRSINFNELYNDKGLDTKPHAKETSDSRGNNNFDFSKGIINANKARESLELLESSINDKKQESISSMFSENLLKEEDYLQLSKVQSMYLLRVINVSNSSGEGRPSVYYVEAIMDMKEDSGLYKSGINFLSVCMQEDQKGNTIITDIARLPQNQN